MANERELSLKITGDSSQAERAVARLEQALAKAEKELAKAKDTTDKLDDKVDDLGGKSDSTGGRLSAFGDRVGSLASDRLGPLGEAAGELGVNLDQLPGPALAAGAAMAGLGAFVADGVGKFTDLAAEVRKVHDVAGTTWEVSSQLVAVSDDLGISADTVAGAMGRLAKNIDVGKLQEFGIEVVRAKDGSVDMAATLGNVAERMNATVDPTRKAAMGTALFGRSWADLAPLLEQGNSGIRDMMASVSDGQIVTEESAAAAREWSMALDDAQDAISELQMALAKDALPTLALMAKDVATATNAVGSLSDKLGGFGNVLNFVNPFTQIYSERLRHQREEAAEAAKSLQGNAAAAAAAGLAAAAAGRDTQDMADAEAEAADQAQIFEAHQKDAAAAAKELADRARDQRAELDKLNAVVLAAAGSTLSYERAVMANRDAQIAVAEKQREATEAVAQFGDEAPEAVAAQQDYEKAVLDAKQAALGQADAAVAQAEKLALASGQTFTAEQKNIVFKKSLEDVRDATNDSNLRAGLDGLIQLTGDAATTAGDAAREYAAAEAAASRLAVLAAGINTNGAGEIIGTADSIERRLANQRGAGSTAGAAAAPPPPPSVVNVQVTSYGTNARDLEGLVTEQLIQQRMERGG